MGGVVAVLKKIGRQLKVTVSGGSAADLGINRDARATIVVRTDGTIDKIENTTTTQLSPTTDHTRPNGDSPGVLECRYTGLTGDPLDASSSSAEDIWRTLVTGDHFFEQRAGPAAESNVSTITIEIRNGSSGPALDSGSYTLDAERQNI